MGLIELILIIAIVSCIVAALFKWVVKDDFARGLIIALVVLFAIILFCQQMGWVTGFSRVHL